MIPECRDHRLGVVFEKEWILLVVVSELWKDKVFVFLVFWLLKRTSATFPLVSLKTEGTFACLHKSTGFL